jgi:hypothetical protein
MEVTQKLLQCKSSNVFEGLLFTRQSSSEYFDANGQLRATFDSKSSLTNRGLFQANCRAFFHRDAQLPQVGWSELVLGQSVCKQSVVPLSQG